MQPMEQQKVRSARGKITDVVWLREVFRGLIGFSTGLQAVDTMLEDQVHEGEKGNGFRILVLIPAWGNDPCPG